MSIRDQLEWLAIVSNAILWGGIIATLMVASVVDPVPPEEVRAAEQAQEEQGWQRPQGASGRGAHRR